MLDFLKNLWDSGILTAVAFYAIILIIANTKNKNIAMFASWTQQAVAFAEQYSNPGQEKKDLAMRLVRRRIRANGLAVRFSEEQISGAIEWALAEMKKNN